MAHRIPPKLEALGLKAMAALPPALMRRLAGRPVVVDGQLLDVETQWLLRLMDLLGEPPAETLPIPQGRPVMRREAVLAGGRQPIGEVRDLLVPGGDGAIGARLFVPRSQVAGPGAGDGRPGPLLVHLHGGGMVYGDLDTYDAACRFLAERSDVRVLSVDYRLAPEHPFPAGVEDVWAAYQWAAEHAGELGADPERVAVGGDSAGGYLSAVVALKAAEAGVPCRFQLLVYPMTDLTTRTESRRIFSEGFYLTEEFMDQVQGAYLTDPAQAHDPLVSVLLTEKIPEGLAPAYVATAGFDPLRDEGEAWARRLADAGVDVTLKRFPGLMHGFFNIVGVGRTNRAAAAEIAAHLKLALHGPS
jgi:acetyl esterase